MANEHKVYKGYKLVDDPHHAKQQEKKHGKHVSKKQIRRLQEMEKKSKDQSAKGEPRRRALRWHDERHR